MAVLAASRSSMRSRARFLRVSSSLPMVSPARTGRASMVSGSRAPRWCRLVLSQAAASSWRRSCASSAGSALPGRSPLPSSQGSAARGPVYDPPMSRVWRSPAGRASDVAVDHQEGGDFPSSSRAAGSAAAEDWQAAARLAANAAMERYAKGDDAAFSALYDALAPRLHTFFLRQVRDGARAEDLLQQTMLQIHCARGRFLTGADVFPWAFAIARRLAIDGFRRRKHEVILDDVPVAATGPGADELLDASRVAANLEREIARLPETQRVAFELVKRDGLSLREAAQVLGTTVTAMKLRAHRAYVALRAAIGDGAGGNPGE
jgi:RNA polymerase sigma-70 factor, ECF subfamily